MTLVDLAESYVLRLTHPQHCLGPLLGGCIGLNIWRRIWSELLFDGLLLRFGRVGCYLGIRYALIHLQSLSDGLIYVLYCFSKPSGAGTPRSTACRRLRVTMLSSRG
jgi:hypothetical protein